MTETLQNTDHEKLLFITIAGAILLFQLITHIRDRHRKL